MTRGPGLNNSIVPFSTLHGSWAWFVALLMFAFPTTVLVVDNASSIIYGLLALTGLYLGWRHPNPDPLSKDEKLLLFSVAFFFAVALLSYLTSDLNYEGWKKLWRTFRFLLLIPIYLVVRRLPQSEGVWWAGLTTGAAVAGLWSLVFVITGQRGIYGSQASGITDPVLFGDLSLAMAFISLGGIPYFRRWHRWLVVAPVAAFTLGCAASFLSGSRGAWLAIPVLFLVLFFMAARRLDWVGKGLLLGGVLLLFALVYAWPVTGVAQRANLLFNEFAAFFSGRDVPGSINTRVEMWRVAWLVFLENPLLGTGLGGFVDTVSRLVAEGRLAPGFLRFTHPLNEFFLVLATRGLLGLLSLLLLFGVPLKHFLWAARHRDEAMRHLAYAGIVLIVGYVHFGLTESIFNRNISIIFYAFSLAVTYGLLRARERAYLRVATKRKQTLSVIIIAKNEADRIRETLDSVYGWADEIIVLDSGSTDDTVAICREYTDKVYETDWPGFGKQKQRALDKAVCDWVLSIDADEQVSPELRAEIDKELQDDPSHTGYDVHRPVIIFGKVMDFSGSGQSPLRLFKRTTGYFTDVPVHEKVMLREGSLGRLRGSLYHETYRDYGHAVEKFAEYAWLQAGVRYTRGKRGGLAGALLRSTLNFIHNYIVRFGFLDGSRGFVFAALHAQYTFNKYAALWMFGLGSAKRDDRRRSERNV